MKKLENKTFIFLLLFYYIKTPKPKFKTCVINIELDSKLVSKKCISVKGVSNWAI